MRSPKRRGSQSVPRSICSRSAPDFWPRAGVDLSALQFRADFARTLDYYTGFIFDIAATADPAARPLVGGGRYDRLARHLDPQADLPAIGCSFWLDRIAACLRCRAGQSPGRRFMSAAPLIIAVPSKGRLQENATAFFARAGLEFAKAAGSRGYRGIIKGMPGVEIAFLSASEIVTHLVQGSAHFGVTGEDLIREQAADADTAISLVTPLGFGHANVIVAAPQAWIDVSCMADLDDVAVDLRTRRGRKMRVATKYVNLTRAFLARHGIADYRIVESLGATEGTPASGAAEIIVDITTTGATLAANALKVLDDGVILRSQANLAASLQADWSPQARSAARAILTRIAAEEEGTPRAGGPRPSRPRES